MNSSLPALALTLVIIVGTAGARVSNVLRDPGTAASPLFGVLN